MTSAVFLTWVLAWTGDLPSGPQVGDKLPDLKVHAFSGDEAGKEVDALKKAGTGPTLIVFVHQITRPALRFLRPLDDYASKKDKLAAQIVWLGADKDETLAYLKRAEKSLNLKMPIGVSLDGKDGPASYGLNDKVTVTILLARDRKVIANFAVVSPNETLAPRIIASLEKLLGKGK